jgi:spermidine synthase
MTSSALTRDRAEAREYQTATSGVFFKVRRVLHDGRSRFQRIEIVENREYGRMLFLDGLLQTTEKDEFYYHEMLVHPALACHPRPRNVLLIGGGDGGALREVLKHPVEKAWMVEIDGEVVEACREHFGWIGPSLDSGRAELVIGDGNVFVRNTRETFDVILVDSSDPVGPSAVLHAREFYKSLKARLRPGGIIAAQAGSLALHLDQHTAKSRFLKRMFGQSRFYTGPVPTYPVGTWVYTFLSDTVDPVRARRLRVPKGLNYYTPDIHRAAFALPGFLGERLR